MPLTANIPGRGYLSSTITGNGSRDVDMIKVKSGWVTDSQFLYCLSSNEKYLLLTKPFVIGKFSQKDDFLGLRRQHQLRATAVETDDMIFWYLDGSGDVSALRRARNQAVQVQTPLTKAAAVKYSGEYKLGRRQAKLDTPQRLELITKTLLGSGYYRRRSM